MQRPLTADERKKKRIPSIGLSSLFFRRKKLSKNCLEKKSRRNCFGGFDAQFLQFGEKISEKKILFVTTRVPLCDTNFATRDRSFLSIFKCLSHFFWRNRKRFLNGTNAILKFENLASSRAGSITVTVIELPITLQLLL